MNRICWKLYLICMLQIILLNQTISKPLPNKKSDIIAGQDFLSLFIGQSSDKTQNEKQPRKGHHRIRNITGSDDVLPIEKMFTQPDDEELFGESSNHYYGYNTLKPTNNANDETIASTTIPIETQTIPVTTEKTITNLTKKDIQVISVSVSSSVQHTRSNVEVSEDTRVTRDEEIGEQSNNKFIANSQRTDFTIDEMDPLMQTQDDTIKSESSHIHSVVVAPLQPKSRTQRKQDTIVPYQTIIYHDVNGKNDDPETRPISYSSVSQTIGEIRSWREYKQPLVIQNTTFPKVYSEPARVYSEPAKFYGEPAKIYSEPAKVYSEPSKVYGEPEKIYSEPSKIYSQPSQIYSVPSKIYSEPAKMYGEPALVYSEPSKIYYETKITTPLPSLQTTRRIIYNLDRLPYDLLNAPKDVNDELVESQQYASRNSIIENPKLEKTPKSDRNNYNTQLHNPRHNSPVTTHQPIVDETFTTSTPNTKTLANDKISTTEPAHSSVSGSAAHDDDSKKIGYVLEGRNYRKYRVEEKTPDGFIVGEYGVVSHNDGSLRGVRYTADSNINPKLIHEALLKFLSL